MAPEGQLGEMEWLWGRQGCEAANGSGRVTGTCAADRDTPGTVELWGVRFAWQDDLHDGRLSLHGLAVCCRSYDIVRGVR